MLAIVMGLEVNHCLKSATGSGIDSKDSVSWNALEFYFSISIFDVVFSSTQC